MARPRTGDRARPRRLLGWLAGLVVVLGALVAMASIALVDAARDLRAAERLVDEAGEVLRDGDLAGAGARLEEARALVLDANSALRSTPPLALARRLPVVGDNLQSLEQSVELAAVVVHGGSRILDASAELEGPDGTLEVSLSGGQIPLAAIRSAEAELRLLNEQLAVTRRPGSSRFLLEPVRELRTSVHDQAIERREQLDVLERGLRLLRELSGGEGQRRFVIAVANTAEMRGSGGMILSYGVLEGVDGGFSLRDFGRIDEIQPSSPVPDERSGLPADHLRRWAGFDPTLRWRNATVGADFTVSADLLMELYEQAGSEPVHGVIQIDPQGLAAILEGVGPVQVPELGTIDAGNVVDVVLNEAYVRFPDIDDRSDVLGDVAEAAFERLVEGEYPSIRGLAEALVEAVDGGHIRMQTRSAGPNAELDHFGASGALPAPESDHVHLTVQNVSGNKLDYYVDTALRVTGQRQAGEAGDLTVEVEVTNDAPVGQTEPRYVFGPNLVNQEAGLYRGVVSLYLPQGTMLVGSSGGPTRGPPAVFSEDDRPVVSYTVDLPAGATSTVELRLELAPRPNDDYELLLVNQPRVRPTTARVQLDLGDGAIEAATVLDRTWRLRPGADPVPVTAGR